MDNEAGGERITCDGEKVTLTYQIMGRAHSSTIKLGKLGPLKLSKDREGLYSMTLDGGLASRRILKGLTEGEVHEYITLLRGRRPDLRVEADTAELARELDAASLGVDIVDLESKKALREAAEAAARSEREKQKAESDARSEAQKAAKRAKLIARLNERAAARGPQVQVKTYKSNRDYEKDAQRMIAAGWHLEGQSTRTKNFRLTTGFLTNKGVSTVTWIRGSHAVGSPQAPAVPAETVGALTPTPDPLEQLHKLAQLRDAGIVTPEEFEAKKADILARL